MDQKTLKQLTDTIDEITETDNMDNTQDQLIDQLTSMVLTALMILTIKKHTTLEEREDIINASIDRMNHNLIKEFDHKTCNNLNAHLFKVKNRLIGMLL